MTAKNQNPFEGDASVNDPRLESLLDQALAPRTIPGGIPDELVHRILLQTAPLLKTRHDGVLAFIGMPMRGLALAACAVIAVKRRVVGPFPAGFPAGRAAGQADGRPSDGSTCHLERYRWGIGGAIRAGGASQPAGLLGFRRQRRRPNPERFEPNPRCPADAGVLGAAAHEPRHETLHFFCLG